MRRVSFLILLLILLPLFAQAVGKPGAYSTESIEWIACPSTSILRGTVTALQPDDQRHSLTVTVHVEEVLSGPLAIEFTYVLAADSQNPTPPFLIPGHHILLVISTYDRPPDNYFPPFDLEAPFDPPFWTMHGVPLATATPSPPPQAHAESNFLAVF